MVEFFNGLFFFSTKGCCPHILSQAGCPRGFFGRANLRRGNHSLHWRCQRLLRSCKGDCDWTTSGLLASRRRAHRLRRGNHCLRGRRQRLLWSREGCRNGAAYRIPTSHTCRLRRWYRGLHGGPQRLLHCSSRDGTTHRLPASRRRLRRRHRSLRARMLRSCEGRRHGATHRLPSSRARLCGGNDGLRRGPQWLLLRGHRHGTIHRIPTSRRRRTCRRRDRSGSDHRWTRGQGSSRMFRGNRALWWRR